MKKNYMILTLLVFLFSQFVSAGDTIRYVIPSGTSGDGTSWATAYAGGQGLKDAIAASSAGDEVWVAAGTYTPGALRADSFYLKEGVAVYGGFAGSESLLANRNWKTNVTILSGDIDGNGLLDAGNSYHIVFNNTALTNATILDGFTITGGYADDNVTSTNNVRGAGIFLANQASPTINNCIITGNTASSTVTTEGGGMYINASSPIVNDCLITGNLVTGSTTTNGGGVFVIVPTLAPIAAPVFTNCIISNNASRTNDVPTYSGSNFGGGIEWSDSCYLTLNNCLINGNKSAKGGGMRIGFGVSTITCNNLTLTDNYALTNGGGILSTSATALWVVNNSIIWGNTAGAGNVQGQISTGALTAKNSCLPASGFNVGTPALKENCIAVNPLFSNPAAGDFTITSTSPCINTGNDDLNATTTDIRGIGFPRKIGIIDMGAYEFTPTTGLSNGFAADILNAYAISNTELNIKGNVSQNASAYLFNAQGKLILQKKLNGGNFNTIALPSINSGIYILKVKDNGQSHGMKIMVLE